MVDYTYSKVISGGKVQRVINLPRQDWEKFPLGTPVKIVKLTPEDTIKLKDTALMKGRKKA